MSHTPDLHELLVVAVVDVERGPDCLWQHRSDCPRLSLRRVDHGHRVHLGHALERDCVGGHDGERLPGSLQIRQPQTDVESGLPVIGHRQHRTVCPKLVEHLLVVAGEACMRHPNHGQHRYG